MNIQTALEKMILSHSGWRGIFAASGEEEDKTREIDEAHRIIAAGAAAAFAAYLREHHPQQPLVLVGSDTRPTGRAIAEAMVPALLNCGCAVRYAGVTAAPEMMAWARDIGQRNKNPESCGFIYISASHNPIGHNGLKFGLADGGVLPAAEGARLTAQFRSLMAEPDSAARLEKMITGADCAALREVFAAEFAEKKEAIDAYRRFSVEVAWGTAHDAAGTAAAGMIKRGIAARPLGVCCDFNGSARSVSIDKEFFGSLGIQFEAINARPGEIAHRIVPEGESLDPCRAFLEDMHSRNPAFILGYVPDCDGDRGNLVIWDDTLRRARILEAQEVFALACIAELAWIAWIGEHHNKIAVAVNDPTSLRIDRIAEAFGAEIFRAEVGEANVVGLARALREQGYTVRILGEGSAGGNITHPSAVRDPLHTVLAMTKLLLLRTEGGKPGLFERWCLTQKCQASGGTEQYRPDFTLADVIASLPYFVTTSAYAQEAVLKVTLADHAVLKRNYQKIFMREWEQRREELKTRYGIYRWEAAAYNGLEERKGITGFGEAGKGGLKINFFNSGNTTIASIWMRGSATEPVFRIMADCPDRQMERDFIEWQRRMTIEADRS